MSHLFPLFTYFYLKCSITGSPFKKCPLKLSYQSIKCLKYLLLLCNINASWFILDDCSRQEIFFIKKIQLLVNSS